MFNKLLPTTDLFVLSFLTLGITIRICYLLKNCTQVKLRHLNPSIPIFCQFIIPLQYIWGKYCTFANMYVITSVHNYFTDCCCKAHGAYCKCLKYLLLLVQHCVHRSRSKEWYRQFRYGYSWSPKGWFLANLKNIICQFKLTISQLFQPIQSIKKKQQIQVLINLFTQF